MDASKMNKLFVNPNIDWDKFLENSNIYEFKRPSSYNLAIVALGIGMMVIGLWYIDVRV